MSNLTLNNGGLPLQKVSGEPARQASIEQQRAGDEKQLSLISTGGKKRRRRMRGGTGSNVNSLKPISPPVVPNTGSTPETRVGQQDSYNKLAELSGGVNENSKYDTPPTFKGGRRRGRKTRRTRRTKRHGRRTRKYIKRRKYH
jgi:hypothetical protein